LDRVSGGRVLPGCSSELQAVIFQAFKPQFIHLGFGCHVPELTLFGLYLKGYDQPDGAAVGEFKAYYVPLGIFFCRQGGFDVEAACDLEEVFMKILFNEKAVAAVLAILTFYDVLRYLRIAVGAETVFIRSDDGFTFLGHC
jgi:hypothetical protein